MCTWECKGKLGRFASITGSGFSDVLESGVHGERRLLSTLVEAMGMLLKIR